MVVLAVVCSWTLLALGTTSAVADVTAVKGSAFGYSLNVTLFGGPNNIRGVGQVACTAVNTPPGCAPTPAASSSPKVDLPAAGGNPSGTDADGTTAQVGPATFLSTGQIRVATEGSTGATGSVTSTATLQNVNVSGSEALTATTLASTCTASESGRSGSTTLTGGVLFTDSGDDLNDPAAVPPRTVHPAVDVPLPTNPAPNTEVTGHIHVNGAQDNFTYKFNEQIVNPDGSITVNAAHQILEGPTAVGDLIIGQVVCGVTAAAGTTTTTTSPGATTSTTVAGATTTSSTSSSTSTTVPSGGVSGGAFGYSLSVSLLGGPVATRGPAPTVTLPAQGANPPLTASEPSASVSVGPAAFLTSDKLDVSTEGAPGGTVKSSASIQNLNKGGSEVVTAASAASTCSASGAGVSGSTTFTNGTFQTDNGDDDPKNTIPDHPAATTPIAAQPSPNTRVTGHIHVNGTTDEFEVVFNEQTKTADSIIVNAVHQKLLGPNAVGDLYIGQVRCSTTASPGGTTTTTTAPGATTTTSPSGTPGGGGADAGKVGGGAYGFFVKISLFGGAPASRGPAPEVKLPPDGSATPITASAPTGEAVFGPAEIFTSNQIDVSTQGTPGGTVTSTAKVQKVNRKGSEHIDAATASSTCSASATGASGSTTLTDARLETSVGNPDVDGDSTYVAFPASPAPNTSFNAKDESVNDTFRVVVNEQITSAGSITVNAIHMYLLGPTAVGDLIIGQVRCATTAGGASIAAVSAASGLAGTGRNILVLVALALALVLAGSNVWSRSRRIGRTHAVAAAGAVRPGRSGRAGKSGTRLVEVATWSLVAGSVLTSWSRSRRQRPPRSPGAGR